MAVTFVAATAVTTNATSYATASFSPTTGDLLVFMAMVTGATGTAATVTDSLGTITFSLVGTAVKASSADTLYIFVANQFVNTGSPRTLTFHTSGGSTATGGSLSNWRVSGNARVGPDAVRQFAVQSNQAASTTPAPVFGKAALTGNPCFGAIGNATSPATMTPPTSWTEDNDLGYSTPTTGWEVVHIASGFTGTTVTWGSTSASAFASMVLEIDTSSPPISPQLYVETETENPGFDNLHTQGLLSLAVAEDNYGDNVEIPPDVRAFIAPTYTNPVMSSELPGFDITTTQGFLGLMVAEPNYGDNVELPPTVRAGADLILMGYRGYWAQKAGMFAEREQDWRPFFLNVGATSSWDSDVERQKDISWWFSTDDVYDDGITQLQVTGPWDLDSEQQLSNEWRFPFVGETEDLLRQLTPVIVVYNDWTTDGENQLSWMMPFSSDTLSDETVERIVLPFNDWSPVEDGQLDNTWRIGDDVSDSGVERITINLTTGWDTDSEQQFTNDRNTGNLASDAGQDSTGYLIIPTVGYDGDTDSQEHTWTFKSDTVSDEGVERIVLPFNDWTPVEDGQKLWWGWDTDRTVSEEGENFVEIAETLGWDNDGDQQRDNSWSVRDDVSDSGVERITINLTMGWDTDAEQQLNRGWVFGQDTLSDEGVEYIIIPNPTPTVDDERNQFWTDVTIANEASDAGQDTTNYIITPPEDWTTDSENQMNRGWWFSQDTVSDEGIEQVILYNILDNDADQQFSNTWWFGQDDNPDNGVELPQNVNAAADLIVMGWKGYWIAKAGMKLEDEMVENPVTPVVVIYNDWTNDGENQLQQLSQFSSDTLSDEGVEYITLPFNDWSPVDDQQKPQPLSFGQDDVMDNGVERITINLTTGWDTDSEQQRDNSWNVKDEVMDSGVERIQIALTIGWDTDAEQQRDITWRFTSDTLMEDGENFVEIADTLGWDTDADSQKDWSWKFGSDDVLDSGVELVQPYRAWDTDADQQLSNDRQTANLASDSGQDTTNYIILPSNIWDTDSDNQKLSPDKEGIGSDGGQDWTQYIIIPPIVFALDAWDNDAENQKDNSWRIGDDMMDSGVENIILPYLSRNDDEQQLSWKLEIKDEPIADALFTFVVLGWDLEEERSQAWPQWTKDGVDEQVTYLAYSPGVITGWDTDTENQKDNSWKNQNTLEDVDFTNYVIVPNVLDDTGRDLGWEVPRIQLDPGDLIQNVLYVVVDEPQSLFNPMMFVGIGQDIGGDVAQNEVIMGWDNDQEQQIPQPVLVMGALLPEEYALEIIYPPGVIERDWEGKDDQLMWALWNLDQSDERDLIRFIQRAKALKAYKLAAVAQMILLALENQMAIRVEMESVKSDLKSNSLTVSQPILKVREVEVKTTLKCDSLTMFGYREN